MSAFYCIRVIDGLHTPGITTDGRDFLPIPKAADKRPARAVRYCDMRQAAVSPLRGSVEDSSVPPVASPQPSPSPGSK